MTNIQQAFPGLIRAIVTGHTRGLGAALAEQLLQRNIAVLGVSRGDHPALAARFSRLLQQTALDLADTTAVATWLTGNALREFVADAGCVLLFNNAGVVDPIGPLATQNVAAVARAVSLNVAAPLMFASALGALDTDAERRIVHISSGAARNAYAGWSVYCATKAALDHHACAVALDASDRLRIGSVAPGVVDTDMQATIRSTSAEQFPQRERFEQLKRNNQLTSPEAAAQKLVDYALSDAFGSQTVADVRELSMS